MGESMTKRLSNQTCGINDNFTHEKPIILLLNTICRLFCRLLQYFKMQTVDIFFICLIELPERIIYSEYLCIQAVCDAFMDIMCAFQRDGKYSNG